MANAPDAAEPSSPRLAMLETIREFGLARLAASDESEAVHRAHAEYFLVFARQQALDDLPPDGEQALARLDSEHDNLRAALTWLEAAGESDALLRLAVALGAYWRDRGYHQEGRARLERALGHSREAADQSDGARGVWARATVDLGVFEMYQGAFHEAETHLTEGLLGCRAQGATLHASLALLGLAHLATSRGDRALGTALLEEILAMARSERDRRLADLMAGNALNNLAAIARDEGDHTRAVACLEEALSRMRGVKIRQGARMALGDLGDLARDQGDYARAVAFYRGALAEAGGYLESREVADVLEAIGIAAAALGEATRAARVLGAADALRKRMGVHVRMHQNQAALDQAVAAVRADLGEAAFDEAWAAGRRRPPADAVAAAIAAPAARSVGAALTRREREVLRAGRRDVRRRHRRGALHQRPHRRAPRRQDPHQVRRQGARTPPAPAASPGSSPRSATRAPACPSPPNPGRPGDVARDIGTGPPEHGYRPRLAAASPPAIVTLPQLEVPSERDPPRATTA